MMSSVKMFGRMLILGAIAATGVPADQAHAEMDPTITDLETVLAASGAGFDVVNLVEVNTIWHVIPRRSRPPRASSFTVLRK